MVSVSTLALHIFALLMFLMLFLLGYNILPFNFAGLPLKITDNTEYLRGLAWTEKKSHDDILDVNTTIIIHKHNSLYIFKVLQSLKDIGCPLFSLFILINM